MTSRTGTVRHAALTASVLSLSLVLAACGGDDDTDEADPTAAPTSAAPRPQPTEAPEVSPLTGLPTKDDAPQHPVMVVKVDNSSAADPQVGVGEADLVVEELVEGGITRLATFFYDEIPDEVGPVRSMRDSDVGIVSPVSADLVASGGAPGTLRRIAEAKVPTFVEGAAGFFRDDARTAPYDLMLDLSKLTDTIKEYAAPDPYAEFSEDEPAAGAGTKADGFAVTFSGASTTRWKSTDDGYVRTNAPVAAGDDFVADTVLVLNVRVVDAGYLDPGGNPVPESVVKGSGAATIFHDGRATKGRWSKEDFDSPLVLTGPAGAEVGVPAGKTWIELVPKDGGEVTID